MRDRKRLTCKICAYKSDNLVPHIESKHQDLGEDALVAYMEKYECDVVDVVVESHEGPEICGIPLALGHLPELSPQLDSAYKFELAIHGDIVMDIIENKPVMITGHAGTGKSTTIEQIAARTKQGVIRVECNHDMLSSDLMGNWKVSNGSMEWVYGPLPKAMKEGLWLILDEIDFAPAGVLSLLNEVLEPNGNLKIKENGYEQITPHKNFRIFATANTAGAMQNFRHLYQGTNIMNEAFLDRWRIHVYDYPTEDREVQILLSKTNHRESLARSIVRVANLIRDAFKNEEISTTMGVRRVLDWADLMIRHNDPLRAAQIAIFSKVPKEDAEVIRGIIQRTVAPESTRGTL